VEDERVALDVDMIAAELGEKTAHQFADCCGGQRIRIPNRPDETVALTNALGANAARILTARFAGSVIDVPTGSQHRRGEIARLQREGKSPATIARRVGSTQRYVFDVLAEQHYRATHRQDG
jgi:hypothetical protein